MSHCDKSDVAQTHPCWHKVAPIDGIDFVKISQYAAQFIQLWLKGKKIHVHYYFI
jgi:hypothetical protein